MNPGCPPFLRIAVILVLLLSREAVASPASRSLEHFESRVRPLLAEHCLRCHGEKKQEGNLRLDSREGWQKGGDSGPAIDPGSPDSSLLLKAVRHLEKDLAMPPKKRLTETQIADLAQWIAEGAEDPRSVASHVFTPPDIETGKRWWAFQPITRPSLPGSDQDASNPSVVDNFIHERLHKEGLQPSPAADKRTLLRRVRFDLTGLPPNQEETDAFLADSSPEAFSKVVDRLLNSPQYGEQWARHWLDLARYSDTKGYVYGREDKSQVHAWVYRDWVVRSLNEDLPYDRFLLLQIAADQLEPANSPHLAAMGFLTLGRRFLGVTHDIIDDRIDVLMRTTQGLSVGCARCHDHKFDPIPTTDYYALYGVFQSCAEKTVPCGYDPANYPAFEEELRKKESLFLEALTTARKEREGQLRRSAKEYLLTQLELEKYPEETFTQILGAGDISPLIVRRWQGYLERAKERDDAVFRPWRLFAALDPEHFESGSSRLCAQWSHSAPADIPGEVLKAFETPPKNMREVAERYGEIFAQAESRAAQKVPQAAPPDSTPKDGKYATFLSAPDTGQSHGALPARAATTDPVTAVLYAPESPCSIPEEDLINIEWYFPTALVTQLWKKLGEMEKHIVKSTEPAPFSRILVDRAEPSTPRVFKRGNPLTKGESVPRRFLQVLSSPDTRPFSKGSGRLELAQRIASSHNPLTARVLVNRVWMHHFGQGLVPTPSDFGQRSETPSHPELLDWLASRFMEEGWSLKKLHRWILLSATYQQRSQPPTDSPSALRALERDPANKLLWRMNPHKLRFEAMRDAWLSCSGEIDSRVGGKPDAFFASANVRRSLYGFVDRQAVPTVLSTFDFANPDLSIPQRNDTIVPQQALFLLNHPYLAARARALVRSAFPSRDAVPNPDRIRILYERILQREPLPRETVAAMELVEPPTAAAPAPPGAGLNPWEQLAQMLLISNEFLFVD